jgi:hypothetical protein
VAHETPHERGKRHLRQAGYKAGGVTLPKVKRVVKRALVGHEDAEHGGEHKPIKLRSGGPVHGHEAKHRPDRRARGVDGLGDWPNDAQGNENAKSALARGGAHKEHKGKGGKTVINIHQGDPQREQMAHQQGMQQGVQIGARAAAAKLAGAGGAPGGYGSSSASTDGWPTAWNADAACWGPSMSEQSETMVTTLARLCSEQRAQIATLTEQLNARHGVAGEPQTGVHRPCETPRVNPRYEYDDAGLISGWTRDHGLNAYGEQCADTDGLALQGLATEERPSPVTDSEKAADQMRQDILGGKIDKAGRAVVRDACDKMDAPKAGRDAANDALGKISGRGGFW